MISSKAASTFQSLVNALEIPVYLSHLCQESDLKCVQEDLHKLKVKNIDLQGNVKTVDISDLKTATERTELRLRKHTENYLNAINRQVLTVSSTDNKEVHSKEPPKWGLHFGASQKQLILPRVPVEPVTVQAYSKSALRISQGSQQQVEMAMKIMLDTENMDNKTVLKQQNYETRLPLITKKKSAPMCSQKTVKGHTLSNLWGLPASHYTDSPLPLLEEDITKGILSLTEQRLTPPAAKITLQTPHVVSKAAPFHEFHRQHKKSAVGNSRVDSENTDTITFSNSKEAIYGTCSSSKGNTAPIPSSNSVVSARKSKPVWTYAAQQLESELQVPSQTQPPQMSPCQSLQDPSFDCDIVVYHGTIDQKAPGFLALKQHYCLPWGSIGFFLEHTEKLLKDYAVPLATINCKKLAEVASDFELNENPTKSDILSVIKNQSTVEKILNRPGQRYKGQGGTEMAATKIQATWRGYQARKAYVRFRQQRWASGVIAISWLLRNNMARVKKTLKESRQRHLENFYIRAKHLAANWNRIRTSRRTIIHIPSLGYSQCIREQIPDLGLQQNMQMGRLCDILDANVDVIYICPLHLSEELLQYYNKLLGLQAAVRSGNPEDMGDLQDRFKILTPEAINSFPNHHMCLATQLKYSPKTIERIKILIQSRDAYIIGGLPHKDDLAVADMLNVPILGSLPEVAHLYSTKSGSKRIFASACVPTPPGESDIYSNEQMISVLSQLIIDNTEVRRWLFKVNDESGGNGIAYCDVISHLKCYHWVQKERQRYSPEIWSKKWAHEPALVKISQELPGLLAQHVQPVNEKRFPTWEKFLQTFLSQGGVIEAFPLSENVTNLTVDMLIEPTGKIKIVSSGDQLHADGPLRSSGTTIPQCSVDPALLNSLCFKIGETCKSKGVLGYFSVDFVTFIHPQTMEQQVWATDLDLCYSDQLALTQLMLYVTDGNLDCHSSRFEVSLGSKTMKSQHIQHEETKTPPPISKRCAVASTQLRHSSLSVIYYNVLLQMCKAHGVGFDLQEKQGTVFILYEDQKRCRLGMITIGEDLQGVLMTFARNLFIIHQEISAPNMQGETNFKMAIQDIEAILGITAENKLKLEEEQPSKADALKE
ncbi:PREDICTED: IQ domain-containing protein H [Cariama cristata]|uniref:IQ domain-containing protein H n=1 Tax=Cariama cristata TaxID=54380 RepID=UPI00052098E7|nr:PREDICTED: IQ domain-containing protein H [Cariama cristata]